MTPLAENLPASSRLERQLYFVTRQLAGGWLKVWIGSIAASGPKNLSGCSPSDPAVGARRQKLLVWLAAPNHEQPLSFRGLVAAIDPLPPLATAQTQRQV